jgi:hypothetical protein
VDYRHFSGGGARCVQINGGIIIRKKNEEIRRKNLFDCHIIHHRYHEKIPGTEPRALR